MPNILEIKSENKIHTDFDFLRKKKLSVRLFIKNKELEIVYVLNKDNANNWYAFCMNELSYKNLTRSIPYYFMVKIGVCFQSRQDALLACNQSDHKKIYQILLNHSFKDIFKTYKQ